VSMLARAARARARILRTRAQHVSCLLRNYEPSQAHETDSSRAFWDVLVCRTVATGSAANAAPQASEDAAHEIR